jgi:cytochrome c-type biogenesis protein
MTLSLSIAFAAGLVSLLSPCVLPLVPGYLAYLAGVNVGELERQRRAVFLNAACFVLGFSVVFAALGVLLNTVLEAVAYDVQVWLSRVGGVLIIFFGLYLTGLVKVGFLEQQRSVRVQPGRFSSRYVSSFVFGAAFAAGWTPCVGAVLGGILGLAAAAPGAALGLLLAYALGLGLPFLVVATFTSAAQRFTARRAPWLARLEVFFGLLLVVIGVLMFTSRLSRLANFEFLSRLLPVGT